MIIEKHKRPLNRKMVGTYNDVVKAGDYNASIVEVIMQPDTNKLIFVFKVDIDGEYYYLAEDFDLDAVEEDQLFSIVDLCGDEKGISFRDILEHGGRLVIEQIEEKAIMKSKIISFTLMESVSFDCDLNDLDDDEYDQQRG
ncbi:hypothetical protein GH811_02700 [Acetobacterium malicum]|uniref:DUF1828 domain-containing protein n=1 Tax=Acetobacterium malicum TaxID=52692 RepID=A0ABR6YTJ7_9FIRM|nr:hypothetical protein [Acetobacterium malicum]MBC3898526.1 hypothetical protein [Acetobacterium malicum]